MFTNRETVSTTAVAPLFAPSTVSQARARLGDEPLEWLFHTSAQSWAYESARAHQGIGQRIPGQGDGDRPSNPGGRVVAIPILGGLHHDYRWAA